MIDNDTKWHIIDDVMADILIGAGNIRNNSHHKINDEEADILYRKVSTRVVERYLLHRPHHSI